MVKAVRGNHVGGSKISNCADHHDFARLFASRLAPAKTQDAFQKLMKYISTAFSAGKTRVSTRHCPSVLSVCLPASLCARVCVCFCVHQSVCLHVRASVLVCMSVVYRGLPPPTCLAPRVCTRIEERYTPTPPHPNLHTHAR